MKRINLIAWHSFGFVAFLAAFGCKSTGQPADPYACRIPPPPTYSYSSTLLGQQPNQQTVGYTPQGGATTYPGTATGTTCPTPGATCPVPAPSTQQGTGIIPITPSSAAGPSTYPPGATYNPTNYGSINGAATLYQTSATSTNPPPADAAWVAAQSVPTAASSETAARNMETRAGSVPMVTGSGTTGVSTTGFDAFAVSSSQVVTQVGDAPKSPSPAAAPAGSSYASQW